MRRSKNFEDFFVCGFTSNSKNFQSYGDVRTFEENTYVKKLIMFIPKSWIQNNIKKLLKK